MNWELQLQQRQGRFVRTEWQRFSHSSHVNRRFSAPPLTLTTDSYKYNSLCFGELQNALLQQDHIAATMAAFTMLITPPASATSFSTTAGTTTAAFTASSPSAVLSVSTCRVLAGFMVGNICRVDCYAIDRTYRQGLIKTEMQRSMINPLFVGSNWRLTFV
eukprot:TRINITY_DN107_c0_g1_i4.p1 TRINITY_DN107_c0_g1~~TRINITY_DN107_c0_g1_i4.p1  ORF type:complete len:161 (-),score=8.60 TRINITY_DN107_c0_g1_i4:2058-2540(-)